MLSKVLNGRVADEAQDAIFPIVPPRNFGPAKEQSKPPAAGAAEELDVLRGRLRQLEAELQSERHEAFQNGVRQGEQQARAEVQPVMERLNNSILEIVALRPEMRLLAERDVVKLALLIARRVLHRELTVDENALTAIARVAFDRLTRTESYCITVHPRFAQAIAAALPGNLSSRVRIEPDPNAAPGTLIIHSPEGVIDASVEAQLEEISRGLADRLAVK